MSAVNWEKIKQEYLTGTLSYRALAKKHSISFNTLKSQAIKEKWFQERKQFNHKVTTKMLEKKMESEVQMIMMLKERERRDMEKVLAILDAVLDVVKKGEKKEFLFEEMNIEAKIEQIKEYMVAREKVQNVQYRSFDIPNKVDVTNKLYDFREMEDEEIKKYAEAYGKN